MSPQSKGKRGRPANAQAQYRRLAERLRAGMTDGRFAPGALLPSLRTLGRRYGVGYRTAWLAVDLLKREGRLAPAAGRRLSVLAAGARSASVRSPILEVVSYSKLRPALASPIGWGLHLGVGVGADDIDAPLLTVHDASLQRQVPEGFESLGPRGVVLLGHYRRKLLRFYERSSIPTVLVDWPESSWKGHAVYVDNAGASEDAVQRLVAMGHRHIAFVQRLSLVQGDLDLDAKERAKSMLRALKKAGAAPGREVAFTTSHRDGDENPALERLLKARPAFSAVLTSDGGQAARIIEAARAAGRSVPGDLSVASFQPREGEERAGLSGPCIDFEAMGREAVGLLQHPARPARQRRFPAVWRAGKTAAARR